MIHIKREKAQKNSHSHKTLAGIGPRQTGHALIKACRYEFMFILNLNPGKITTWPKCEIISTENIIPAGR